MRSDLAARLSIGAVAIVAIGWLGVLERDRRVFETALEQRSDAPRAERTRKAQQAVRAAQLLNPDTAPKIADAVLYQSVGRLDRAKEIVEGVLRSEPDNLTAWGLLYLLAGESDPATARRALDAQRRLDPLGARRRR
jgi:tetratricopeptide (TPR) repeat protein